jgi:hypothetical protein
MHKGPPLRGSDCQQRDRVARQVADPLEAFTPFKAYKRRGVEATISCMSGAQARRTVTDWAFALCKANMQVRQHRDPVVCRLSTCVRPVHWQPSTHFAQFSGACKLGFHFGVAACRLSMRGRATWGGRTPISAHS